MPSSYVSLNIHVVFSTKNRNPLFREEFQPRVHDYLGGVIRGLGAIPIRVGGVEDHVHLLFAMKANQSVSKLVQEIKKSSTIWIRNEIPDFGWQEGYGAFSVSQERMQGAIRYIENQKEHHSKMSFDEERQMLFRLAGIELGDDL